MHDAPRAVRKSLIAAGFGRGRQDVGVLVVVAAPHPPAQPEQDFIHLEIALDVLGHLRGLVEAPVHARRNLLGALLVHAPVELDLVVESTEDLGDLPLGEAW